MRADKVADKGRIQQIALVAIAGTASVLFDAPRIEQADPMALSMEPQCQRMAVGSGGFQACPNFRRVVLLKEAGQLSKAFGVVSKAETHFVAAFSQLGLHAFLGHIEAQHREFGSGRSRW